uniref:Uncharacterized protein n=1 Tax=Romanomermis culicivorax TaxID=13658 RepID=A0A915JT27_ROMCU
MTGHYKAKKKVAGQHQQESKKQLCKKDHPCKLLRAQGVDPSTFVPAIEFDKSKFQFNPSKPKVPGCIHLTVTNSTIKQALKELTAEFELRIGADPDPQNPRISCRQTQKPCSCSSGKSSWYD